ncbi:MAG: SdiA-regulated domain-containing protein [Flavobacteriaceae bacterium]
MKQLLSICIFFIIWGCTPDYGKLSFQVKLPKVMEEVSGVKYDAKEDAFWMLNDSGNAASVYLISKKGKILRELTIDAKNNDWEDITMDAEGNLYIGDFGNNYNERKNLRILKIHKDDLQSTKKINVEKVSFFFPEQENFPPKKKKKYYDVESLFEWKGHFYVFTKSRVKNEIGRTFLYRIPNQVGNHAAERISDFTTCPGKGCWITGADISKDGKNVILLNHTSAWLFENFKGDDFFSGAAKEYPFEHDSQKESITFKNDTTIYLADEDESGLNSGRNLYMFRLN